VQPQLVKASADGRAHQRRAQAAATPFRGHGHTADVAEAVVGLGLQQHVPHHLAAAVDGGERSSRGATSDEVAQQLPAIERPRERARA
jgi:hypothetical protein